MKNWFLLCAFLLTGSWASAQNQGHIKYKIDAQIPDNFPPQAKAFMPTFLEIFNKDGKSRVKTDAPFMNDILSINEKEAYLMDEVDKEAKKLPDMTADAEKSPKPKVTKNGKTLTILGRKCVGYEVELKMGGQKLVSTYYADPTLKLKISNSGGSQLSVDGVEGIPLRMELKQGPISMVFEATEVDTASAIDEALFKVPNDFKVSKFDPKEMMGGMGN